MLEKLIGWLTTPLLLAALAGAGSFAAMQSIRLQTVRSDLAAAVKAADAHKARAMRAESDLELLKIANESAAQAAQAQGEALNQKLQGVIDETERKAKAEQDARVAAERDRAADVDRRVRERLRALAAAGGARADPGAGPANPGTAGQCETAFATTRMLADMLGRALEHGRAVAGFGTAAHASGAQCEQAYGEVKRQLDAVADSIDAQRAAAKAAQKPGP